jgi:hypothetical protein
MIAGEPSEAAREARSSSRPGTTPRTDAAMTASVSRAEVGKLVDQAMTMTEQRLADAPAGSVHNMYSSIRNQLRFMRETVDGGGSPTIDEKNRLTLGVIAVREFETSDPDYCDAITLAVFNFKKL